MVAFIQLMFNGLVFGSVILLGAVGLSLLYGVADFPNFSHGALLTLSAYIVYAAHVTYGVPFLIAAFIGVIATAILAVLIDQSVLRFHRNSSSFILLIVTVGVAFILRSVIRIIWGSSPLSYQLPLQQGKQIFGLTATTDDLLVLLFGIIFAFMTHLLLTRTDIGVGMRATADNKSLAKVTGINTTRIVTITWGVAGALAAIGGIFLGVTNGVLLPRMGFNILLVVFAAVILGGIGSPYGAMIGAYLIGIAQEFGTSIPGISPGYRYAVAFVVLIVVLLVYPNGIAGARES